ncbi:unnamed protein product [Amoebophrya sp. A25]|nr:unnamed protein product [Amoebophrya sp. A25]|eukprot:GSA25T00006097001.1
MTEVKKEPAVEAVQNEPAAKRVKTEPGQGSSSSSAAPKSRIIRAQKQEQIGDAPGDGDQGEASLQERKLDEQPRILSSIHLLNANVEETSAALYWICDAKMLKKVGACIQQICKEVSITANTEDLTIAGVDQGRSCVCECRIMKSAFTRYRSQVSGFQLGLDLTSFMRILSPFKDNDMVVFCLESENAEVMKIQGYHTYKRNNEFSFIKVRLQEASAPQVGLGVGLENNSIWSLINMTSSEFTEVFKDLKEISGKTVDVEYTVDGKLILKLPDDTVGVSGSMTLKEGGGLVMTKKPETEDIKISVNAEHIAKFGPMGSQLSDRVTLYIAHGYPFVCQFQDAKKTNWANFYLIPRVQG